MKVQIGKMILYGVMSAIFYIAVPIILFEVIGALNIMTFSQEFKLSIIIFGIIGVAISMLRHLFPPDTSANRLIAFGATVYSGIYLFYMFGGFTPGVSLGTYSISLPTLQLLLGLQLIAWLLLTSSGIRALQYLVEAMEIYQQKEYSMNIRRKFKLSKVFKAFGTIMSLVIAGYFGSLIYSGTQLGFKINPSFVPDYNNQGTNSTSDDTLDITMSFNVTNNGLYAIYDLSIDVRDYTITSVNTSALPEDTKIAESLSNSYGTFHAFTAKPNNNVTVNINPIYAAGLITTDATLEFKISFSTLYAGILVNLNISIQNVVWTALI